MAKVAALTARVAELEVKLSEPPKTPDNSSLPPSRRYKTNKLAHRNQRKGRHHGVGRELRRAIAIDRRRNRLKDSTLLQYRANLELRKDAIMKLLSTSRHGIRLRKRFAKIRSNLSVFVTNRTVPYTNNASERALRPSAVFRKVTNGLRSQCGGQHFAAVRSVVHAGRPATSPSSKPSAQHSMETPSSC
jgi:hypothetical protein